MQAERPVSGCRPGRACGSTITPRRCCTWLQNPVDLDRPIRWELVQAAYAQRAAANRRVRAARCGSSSSIATAGWSNGPSRSPAATCRGNPAATPARLRDSWREPLIEELSKETYNAMTELRAVLESQAWDDAARLVTSLDPEAAPGVAPYVNDKALLTSLPVAVQLTLGEYPQLRQSLGDRFAALAKLRIGQAIAAGDAATIELATVQFAGTEAAAEAHQWLGDRALAGGAFTRALLEYRRAGQMRLVAGRGHLAADSPGGGDARPRRAVGGDQARAVRRAVAFGRRV